MKALAVLAVVLVAAPAWADESAISLASLETKIDQSYGVRAAVAHVDAAKEAEAVAQAQAGWGYYGDASFGPRSDIVTSTTNNQAFRFEESAGVQHPLFGRAAAQQLAVGAAETDVLVATAALHDQRTQALETLRTAYIEYWRYLHDAQVADAFYRDQRSMQAAAKALVKTGFWTQANYLDYLELTAKSQTDRASFRSSARAALTSIASALGEDVAAFRPVEPSLDRACNMSLNDAVESSVRADPQTAEIDARLGQTRRQLDAVRGVSVDALAHGGAGLQQDVGKNAGYDVTVGVTASLPTHERSEERALREQLVWNLAEDELLEQERRFALSSEVSSAFADLRDSRFELQQARSDETSKLEALRESKVRFSGTVSAGASAFDDLQLRKSDLYVARVATIDAQALLWTKGAALSALAPDACETKSEAAK